MGSIRIVTEIPGPRSIALSRRARESVGSPLGPHGEIFISNAKGSVVEDVDGNHYLDFIAGVGCLMVGHSHPRVVEAVRAQVERFSHTDFSVVPYEVYLTLAERLAVLCGGNRRVALFNSGAEAVENAIKIAKGSTGRSGVICFNGAFHGRTLMAMSLTSKEIPYKRGFGPFAPGVHRVPYPGLEGATSEQSLDEIRSTIEKNEIAAVIIEPVLGEGGFIPAPADFLRSVERVCRESDVVFVADEVQSGYGRTGRFLAVEWSGVRPDLVVLGKSIAAGLPLSAVVGDPNLFDALDSNSLGGTYPGNPVACAAALAVLDVIEGEGLLERAVEIGGRLTDEWGRLSREFPSIAAVRGLGAMVGAEMTGGGVAGALVQEALRQGLLIMTAGVKGQVIRHLMPLVTTDDQLGEGFEALRKALSAAQT